MWGVKERLGCQIYFIHLSASRGLGRRVFVLVARRDVCRRLLAERLLMAGPPRAAYGANPARNPWRGTFMG
jgi:hypothetical protein